MKLRIHWRLSTISKASNKSQWSNHFWYVKVCIFWKGIQYTTHCNKTQIFLEKMPSFFTRELQLITVLLWFSLVNLRFWYETKHKLCVSKTVLGIFHFWLRSVFIKVYNFVQQNAHNYLQNKNNRKATHSFAPRPFIYKL